MATRDMIFMGRRLNADEAVRYGLVSRIVPLYELEAAAEQAALEVLQSAPEAREQFKRIVHDRFGVVDGVTLAASFRGAEVREGMTAFAEKRAPSWVPEALRKGRL